MTIHEAQQQLLFQLYHVYDQREALNITHMVMEHLTEWRKIDRILNKNSTLSDEKLEQFHLYTKQLLEHRPVQYVLGEVWFAGLKFYVDENVLIPRPETDELVDWIYKEKSRQPAKLLDVGTGSGCIAISLKKKSSLLDVHACDISAGALNVAKKNADLHNTIIHFHELNFLDSDERNRLPIFDIIVSNPPYIPKKDSAAMDQNVLNFEPHLALFVEDNDPLIFYRAIADFAKDHLTITGEIYVEIHESLAKAVAEVFQHSGFQKIDLRKDMQGKERMMKISRLAD